MKRSAGEIVLFWTRSKLGHQVGRGECWDLADAALHHAGARSSTDYGPVGPEVDYVWGTEVMLHEVHPGDLLQFRDFLEVIKVDRHTKFADGKGFRDSSEEPGVRGPQHTAIVDAVLGLGVFVVLEQHVKPLGRKVQRHTIHTRATGPTTRILHKMVMDPYRQLKPATVEETTTISVSGVVRAFRPQPK